MEIILGFALMAALFLALGVLMSKQENLQLGPLALLLFGGFAVFSMGLLSSAIYTEWNNTAIYNSTMTVPETLVTLSTWGQLVYVLFAVVGFLIWLLKWFAEYKVGQR